MRWRASWFLGLMLLTGRATQAAGFWLPTGDRALRDDVTLLMDEGVLRLPITTWPIPVADVRAAMANIDPDNIGGSPALRAAFLRLQSRVEEPGDAQEWQLREVSATAGKAGLLRDYGTLARDEGEVRSSGGTSNDRWDMTITAEKQFAPIDGHGIRFNGSDLTVRWGNWLFSANTMDRWYGPGEEGSLSLSNNARPMPQLSLDRLVSSRSSLPILRWFGPWRFTAHAGIAESHRPDLSNSRFMAQRLTFQPLPIVEFGLFRTAQFCGQYETGPGYPPPQLASATRSPCNLSLIRNSLIGHENVGIGGVTVQNKAGNQMAGIDTRITSPFQALPIALYAQLNGEDVTHTKLLPIPSKFLGLIGGEAWGYLESGSVIRAHIEYSNTTCKFTEPSTYQGGCAYRNGLFFAGYRYDYRNIGYSTDANSEFWMADISETLADSTRYGVKLRHGTLDKNQGGIDPYSSVTITMSHYNSAEGYWSGRLWGQDLSAQLGWEHQTPVYTPHGDGPYGFLQWHRKL